MNKKNMRPLDILCKQAYRRWRRFDGRTATEVAFTAGWFIGRQSAQRAERKSKKQPSSPSQPADSENQ